MLFEPLEPNERFRARREAARRRTRRRRQTAAAILLGGVASVALGAKVITGEEAQRPGATTAVAATPKPATPVLAPMPDEVRGIHVTMALASLPGKLDAYIALQAEGLNTIQLDVKDENGEVGFIPSAVPLATQVGAAKPYYRPRAVARLLEQKSIYLIGRVVVFEDPRLAEGAPELALKNPDGSIWRNRAGLAWSNPYDRRVWDYNVSLAEVAARAGFDEIQFDYVRFPSDGDVERIVFPGKTAKAPGWVVAEFVHYAAKRLKPLGVRVSADVFGLAASRDLGIGQVPRRLGKHLDAISPMVYPSHYNSGEFGLPDPNAEPGATVAYSLTHFRRELRGTGAQLRPWLQDFSHGRAYGIAELREQIEAARKLGARGYLLWNPAGIYTPGALAPAPK
jgi:hypothetical protein